MVSDWSAPLFRLTDHLLAQTRELIEGCGCYAGCPACVGPVCEIGERGKGAALALVSGASREMIHKSVI